MAARLVRPLLVVSLFAALAAVTPTPPVAASPGAAHAQAGSSMSSLEFGVLEQLNAIRRLHNLVPLTVNRALDASAEQHSREMALKGYFEHTSADGTVFWKRIQHWYGSTGYGYWSVGENLLWSSPDVDPVQALRMWMSSPEHRANILNGHWRQIGISAVHADSAPGAYEGMTVTIITTDFGVRS
jgi:uncharacterized protein YkwD